ncbi:peptidoglycan DD-metalloendopeptidase family protein [Mangrovimicrobium sediminis]|uniref:peptidoglycan DD-metalloendopeptidase family protein n=1 Tax=Mangrovimicrobium sediminis TaxID=2562682 RepID=UPI001F0EE3E4|nr:peptidoglycan DD-metalloendopeptidase family protein [Haliea sp. SAOS-164]
MAAGAVLALGVALAIGLRPAPSGSDVHTSIDELTNPVAQATALVEAQPVAEPVTIAEPAPPAPEWVEETVRSGDNLSLIFKRAGYTTRDVYEVTNSPDGKALARIYPGQTIAFHGDEDGTLSAIRHVKNALETITYYRGEDGFSSEVSTRTPEVRRGSASGVITSSLYMAGKEAGLSTTTIMDMANIFGGVIDFVGDPRKGDTMELVFEQEFLDGKRFADGAILAASYTNRGKTFTAFRYTDSNGDVGYYSEDGISLRRAFLLAPVDFTRISSNFNPRRLHPVLGTLRPHRGTDYAAPTGTPVYAAGDGRVVKSGYSSANGNYVFIRHGDQFETKYLHLSKRRATVGQKVTQGQVIGNVGATGLASGPHLHYEFLMNGVHRDPRTVHKFLPKAKALPDTEMPAFRSAIADTAVQLAQLREREEATRMAMAEHQDGHG